MVGSFPAASPSAGLPDHELSYRRPHCAFGLMPFKSISSPQNDRIKAVARLRRHAHRIRQGRTLIDGLRELTQAANAGVTITEAYFCRSSRDDDPAHPLLDRLAQSHCDVYEVSSEAFAKISYGQRTAEPLGVAIPPQTALHQLQLPPVPLIAVLEGIEKPGNLGAIVRSADAAGIDAIVVANERTDLYNPNTIRASLGTVFSMSVCTAKTADVIPWLREIGVHVFAAEVDGPQLYTEADLTGPTALVLGSEADGLTPAWRDCNATSVQLPMQGVANSLNVSATAAVLFYEARRQRNLQPGMRNPDRGT